MSRAQSAAFNAPRAKIIRSSALCANSMRSAGPANTTVCSPTTEPPRKRGKTDVAGIASASLAVAHPNRVLRRDRCHASAAALPEQQRGAGRRVDLLVVMHFEDFDVEIIIQCLGAALGVSAASRFTPRLILPDLTITARLGGVLDLGFIGGA